MNVVQTGFPGLVIIEPHIFKDSRGYFFESYQYERYFGEGIKNRFIQDNESKSGYGVVRGLHYQLEPYSQAKLVRVVEGVVFDVAVDLRKGSPTFGKWKGFGLSSENKKQLFVPVGFAHGFSVLSDTAILSYKCDRLYSKENERGINIGDPFLNIDWQIPKESQIISDKDKHASDFAGAEMNFTFEG